MITGTKAEEKAAVMEVELALGEWLAVVGRVVKAVEYSISGFRTSCRNILRGLTVYHMCGNTKEK